MLFFRRQFDFPSEKREISLRDISVFDLTHTLADDSAPRGTIIFPSQNGNQRAVFSC